jgi:transcriptional regulator with XRE-family HTH domain
VAATPIGPLLQYWRKTRNLSQLALAHEADVSPRHICFVETGRARPSREMVLLLATALDVPLRERNALLLAAGFAPVYGESSLDAPGLAVVRVALAFLLAPRERPAVGNVLRLMFDPEGLRPYVQNWTDAAAVLLQRAQRETVSGVKDPKTDELLQTILAYPGVPERLRPSHHDAPLSPVVPIRFRKDGLSFDYFSTLTTLGTPLDITAQETRIECFFPANEETAEHARARWQRVSARRVSGDDDDLESTPRRPRVGARPTFCTLQANGFQVRPSRSRARERTSPARTSGRAHELTRPVNSPR